MRRLALPKRERGLKVMPRFLFQIGALLLVLFAGGGSAPASEPIVRQILEDSSLFPREAVEAIREMSRHLAQNHSSSIMAVLIENGPSLDEVEKKYGKSRSTIESMPVPPYSRPLVIHWYGNLGLAVPQGDEKRPIVALFVEGPEELP